MPDISEQSPHEILIVDDSPSDRTIFRRLLEQNKEQSYVFREAESIRQALTKISAGQPDCILLDYDLPDGTAIELIDKISADYGRNSIPIVMLSGTGTIQVALETTRRGAQDFLIKGKATAVDLVRAVTNAIDKVKLFQDRKTAREKIQLSEERYRKLFNSIDEGFCVIEIIFNDAQKAVDYRFLEVNEAFEKQTGMIDAKGQTMRSFAPDHEEIWFERYGQVALTGKPIRFENRAEALNRWFDVYAFRIEDKEPNKVAVLFNDISERRLSEEKIRESEQKFSALAEMVPQLVWMAEPDGNIFWYNRNWYDYTGMTPAEMLRDGWKSVHDPQILPKVVKRWQDSLQSGETFEMEFPLRRNDGQFRWFLTRVNPLRDPEGRITRWFGTNTDIEEIRQMRLQAEQANNLKDEFLATLSHELRTPLNAILGWSQIIQNRPLDSSEMKNAFAIIDRSARSQNQLIDDILDVSRIITGKFRLDVRAIDLIGVITAATETSRPSAEAKNIKMQVLLDPKAANISGDPDRLQQVIWNLLSNAVKFTPKHGRIQIRLERVDSHVEIVISDTGKGIEAEFLPYVFDRFRQSDGSMTRRHGGLGLGLAIVRQIVELHGGTVGVESAGVGQGATFRINLPLMPIRIEPVSDFPRVHPEADNDEQESKIEKNLSGLRILIVEDEADSRDLLKLALESGGASIIAADSATAAFEMIQREKFDVLISDIGMPEENGFSFIKKIRKLPAESGGKTPAVALTAYARAEDRIRALQSGFQMHISKPINFKELAAIILNLAGRITN